MLPDSNSSPSDSRGLESESDAHSSLAYFQTVRYGFESAARSCGLVERFYEVGGYSLRLRFAGNALCQALTPAFEHLRVESQSRFDFSVGLWDSASTRTPLSPPPFVPGDLLSRCGVRDHTGGRIQMSYESQSTILSVLDSHRDEGFFWIRDAARLPLYQCGSPLLILLHSWMAMHKRTLVHGGAVGTPDGGVLLVGRGGSGKSTATLCCLGSDLLYGADDYGLIALEPRPYFHSLYCSGKVNSADADRFPLLSPSKRAGVLDTGKSLYFLHPSFSGQLSLGFPLRAIVLPRVMGQSQSRVRPAKRAEAMLALAPSTLFQLPGAEVEKFERLGELVRTLPAFVLESGTDWTQIPRVLGELVATLNADTRPHE